MTANLGGYDDPLPALKQNTPCDFVYFSDQDVDAPGWEVRKVHSDGHPCLEAKRFKMDPPVPHRYVIWVDANIRIESASFAFQALSYIHDGIAVHSHPFRHCIYDEALETIFTPKYDDLPVQEQIRHYRLDEDFKPRQGLYACGVVAWDRKDEKARQVGSAWLSECFKWGFQDQLSLPVVLRRLDATAGVFPHDQYRSPWFRVLDHR